MKYHKTTKVDNNFINILAELTDNIKSVNGDIANKDYTLSITGIGSFTRNQIDSKTMMDYITKRDGASIVLAVYYQRFVELYGFVYYEGHIFSVDTSDLRLTCDHVKDKNKRDMVFCEYNGLRVFPKLQ